MVLMLIAGISLWVAFIYFMLSPWLAAVAAAMVAVLGVLTHLAYWKVRERPDTPGVAELISLEEALKCKGPAPLDRHYADVDREAS